MRNEILFEALVGVRGARVDEKIVNKERILIPIGRTISTNARIILGNVILKRDFITQIYRNQDIWSIVCM